MFRRYAWRILLPVVLCLASLAALANSSRQRWAGLLRVWMHSGAGNAVEQRDLLQKHLRHLAGITRLPLQFVDRARDANVRVFFCQ